MVGGGVVPYVAHRILNMIATEKSDRVAGCAEYALKLSQALNQKREVGQKF